MKRKGLLFAVILASLVVLGAAAPARAGVSIQIGLDFHDSLSPHGDWLRSERYGDVWAPRHLDYGWRPYTRGRWAYTDDDWTWVSDEEWGWATDHYGRWYFDRAEGWVWVPGEEWAPAWVAWRRGGGYVGWAPLPPEYDAFGGGGVDISIDPFAYSFIPERHMLDRAAYREFVPPARNVTYLGLTQNETHYGRVNDRVVNRGIDIRAVETFTGHAVPRSHIREAPSAAQAHAGREQRGDVAVYRPRGPARGPAAGPAGAPGVPIRPIARVNVEGPEQLARRQAEERKRLQSSELKERGQLRKIQTREVKHPPVVAREGPPPPQPPKGPRPRPATIDREELKGRHDAEQKAQAEHEQREQQELKQRHQREARAVAEAPKPAPAAKGGKPAGRPAPKQGHDKGANN